MFLPIFNFILITISNYSVQFRIARHSNKTLLWHTATTHAVLALMTGLGLAIYTTQ